MIGHFLTYSLFDDIIPHFMLPDKTPVDVMPGVFDYVTAGRMTSLWATDVTEWICSVKAENFHFCQQKGLSGKSGKIHAWYMNKCMLCSTTYFPSSIQHMLQVDKFSM